MIQSVGVVCPNPRLSEDLCVDSLAATAALVREEFDIALAEEAAPRARRRHGDGSCRIGQ